MKTNKNSKSSDWRKKKEMRKDKKRESKKIKRENWSNNNLFKDNRKLKKNKNSKIIREFNLSKKKRWLRIKKEKFRIN